MIQLSKQERTIRLNKYIANSGLCNRREADELIKKGEIKVNGKVETGMGVQVTIGVDKVTYLDRPMSGETMRYILINKPSFYVVEGKGGKSIFALMADACEERLYPVNPLSLRDVGLQLFTNDKGLRADLVERGPKEASLYHITLDREITPHELQLLSTGVKVGKRVFKVNEVVHTEGGEGKGIGLIPMVDEPKRIKEALKVLGLQVEKFDRVTYAGLTKKSISRGKWRALTEREVSFLKMGLQ